MVAETSEGTSLPKDDRRRARIAAGRHKSPRGRLVKAADLISNLRAVAKSPPAGWGCDRQLGYLDGCRQLMDSMRGPNPGIEARFDAEAADAEQIIRAQMQPSSARRCSRASTSMRRWPSWMPRRGSPCT